MAAQRQQLPDFVANLRVDQSWGSAQVSAAVHNVSIGQYVGSSYFANGAAVNSTIPAGAYAPNVDSAWGYAVQAGVKFNLPFLAPGDALWLQAAYAKGGMSYTGISAPIGRDSPVEGGIGGGGRF